MATSQAFTLLSVFSDSLYDRWHVQAEGATINKHGTDATHEQCGRSLSVSFASRDERLVLSTDPHEPVTWTASVETPLLSFAWAVHGHATDDNLPDCAHVALGGMAECHADMGCVAAQLGHDTNATRYLPICRRIAAANASTSPWSRALLPLPHSRTFIRGVDKLLFVPPVNGPWPFELRLDDISFASRSPPRGGALLPTYGRYGLQANDPGAERAPSGWDGTTATIDTDGSAGAGHGCAAYMTAPDEAPSPRRQRALCKVDGDHLAGRWGAL
eukprot:1697549-Prymnesium_polylepis.2